MRLLLSLEELAVFGVSLFVFTTLHFDWWWLVILFLTPDISMLGYLFGNKVGANLYNLFHHKAFGIILFVVGSMIQFPWLQLSGVILLAHSSLDRVFGYGLKYADDFQHTHTGIVGKK
jgi:hypothetical protein